MLRKIHDDILNKSYARRAREEIHESKGLLAEIKKAVRKTDRRAAAAITSVVESKGTAIVRAESHAAVAELYRVKDVILGVLRGYGIEQLRFRV